MTHSYRRTPVCSWGSVKAGSERWFKRKGNRRWRQAVRAALQRGQYDALPAQREVSNVWSFPKDGKQWFGYDLPQLMRK